jgi:hypothetical protein
MRMLYRWQDVRCRSRLLRRHLHRFRCCKAIRVAVGYFATPFMCRTNRPTFRLLVSHLVLWLIYSLINVLDDAVSQSVNSPLFLLKSTHDCILIEPAMCVSRLHQSPDCAVGGKMRFARFKHTNTKRTVQQLDHAVSFRCCHAWPSI